MNELYHEGIKGMEWGHRRWQNEDGTFNEAGKERYFGKAYKQARKEWKAEKKAEKAERKAEKEELKAAKRHVKNVNRTKVAIAAGLTLFALSKYKQYNKYKIGGEQFVNKTVETIKDEPVTALVVSRHQRNPNIAGFLENTMGFEHNGHIAFDI